MFYKATIISDSKDIIKVAANYIKKVEDIKLIEEAINYVNDKFAHIKRKNGDPYVYHLYTAAYLVAKWNCSPAMIVAALLHDLIEDIEGETYETVKAKFGGEVAFLVDKLTKIRLFEKAHYIDVMGAYMRKILLGMSQDVRVMVIKMADRFNNIETLHYLRDEKQVKYAKETSEVYVPIARALGFNEWANYIDNLCFYYYDKKGFLRMEKLVEDILKDKENNIESVIGVIEKSLKFSEASFVNIKGRKKSYKSIAKKLNKKETIHDIHDIFAIRILCDNVGDCYLALGIIHQIYAVVPNRFKDYISAPKGNMYQSLHTTVIVDGHDVEVQIRTTKMDEVAENGIAAHWKYKEDSYSQTDQQQEMLKRINILKGIIRYDESNVDKEQSQGEWWTKLQEELLGEKIVCLTPQKKAIEMRKGSTVLDFAFRIHTDIGLRAVRGVVNGNVVPLKTKVNPGDVIQIKTQLTTNVSSKWLDWTVSITAHNRIKKVLKDRKETIKKIENESKVVSGENALFNYLKGCNLLKKYKDNQKPLEAFLLKTTKTNSLKELYKILNKDRSALTKLQQEIFSNYLNRDEQLLASKKKSKKTKRDQEVVIEGVSGIKSNFAKCCNPIYGDSIIAVTSKKSGAMIHKEDCHTIHNSKGKDSTFAAEWGKQGQKPFEAKAFIVAINHANVINLILSFFGATNTEIKSFTTKFEGDAKLNMTISFLVKSVDNLNTLIKSLADLKDVIDVKRI